jgi:hypothetical protein
MPWSPTISSDDVVAIHSALVPTVNGDGEILLFGGGDHDRAANEMGQWDHTRRSCRHPPQALVYVKSPDADLFCCGHAFLGDGRFLTAGGTTRSADEQTKKYCAVSFSSVLKRRVQCPYSYRSETFSYTRTLYSGKPNMTRTSHRRSNHFARRESANFNSR